eukprot:scaffold494_cov100-Skeletonema_dohrnii-CCMP3373.AAC.1
MMSQQKLYGTLLQSKREIRYGARVVLVAIPNWASSGHLRGRSTADIHREIRYGARTVSTLGAIPI